MSQHPSHVSHQSPASRPSHQAQQQAISDKEQTTLYVPIVHVSPKDIAKRAFAMFEARGSTHGFDVQDWNSASKALIAEKQAG
jgi:hypothetical protein